jgi:hypothetical protein
MTKPILEHRHFRKIAEIIAALPEGGLCKEELARRFANALRYTNPNFDYGRFVDAALGNPSNWRDR